MKLLKGNFMKYLFLVFILFISACSGSTSDSGIFFSKKKAELELQAKYNDLDERQRRFEKNMQELKTTEERKKAIEYEISNTKERIRLLEMEIAKLEQDREKNQTTIAVYTAELEDNKEHLKNVEEVRARENSPVQDKQEKEQRVQRLQI